MNRHHLIRIEGVVAGVLDAGRFSVALSDGRSMPARVSRRFRLIGPDVIVGDRVLVAVFPRDADRGLIITGSKFATKPRG
jgi:translation initiation factor IF-1